MTTTAMPTTPRPRPPSPKMLQLARVIHDRTKRDGRPPSYRELAAALDVGLSRLADLVVLARARGLIDHTPGERRSLRVVDRRALRTHAGR